MEAYRTGARHSIQTLVILTVSVILIAVAAALVLSGRMVKPIESMTKRINELGESDERFTMDDSYRTGDEIEILAESFAAMSGRAAEYVEKITEITAEKERIGTELALATRIQADMLPNIYPAFPDRREFDIFASMDPAKEVGGDFYDFFLVDDDHLCMVMADVSGKGVPAALFMMASKIILANNAMSGKSPAQILTDTNAAICSNNRVEMFVTVWLGILEISTGRMTAANAGHEYPVVKHPDGSFGLYKDKHGFVVGGMNGVRYREYEMKLEPGSRLFLYTDGVPEATDAEGKMFGTDRKIAALNAAEGDSKQIVGQVGKAVEDFVDHAEQFDDITMLCLEYFGEERSGV
jgi:sigma-B regulation protein RsbU (phosphoserine phosphatase)